MIVVDVIHEFKICSGCPIAGALGYIPLLLLMRHGGVIGWLFRKPYMAIPIYPSSANFLDCIGLPLDNTFGNPNVVVYGGAKPF